MNITDAPKVIVNENFNKAVEWLNQNERSIRTLAGLPGFESRFGEVSWSMPDELYNPLTAEQVNWLSQETENWLSKRSTALDPTPSIIG